MAVVGAPPAGQGIDLAGLLAACTVRLAGEGMAGGTGFFVAPGWVVTCAHVVEGRTSEQVGVYGGTFEAPGRVVAQHPEQRPAGSATYPFPDLALVQVPGLVGQPCVWLDDAIPDLEARLHTYGFTKTWDPQRPAGEPATFTLEGLQEVEGGRLLKVSAGEAVPGMSGGPLLGLGSGRVCGVVKTTRDAQLPRGGWAIPIREFRRRHPEVWAAHDAFHAQDRRWRSLAEGWAQLAELLLEPPPLGSDREGPSALLRPEFEVVGFHGRTELLDQLEGWCLEPGGLGLWLVTGPGGQGKSRLARQLCARMTAHGWLAGPLQRGELTDQAVGRLQATSVACLLVIDYAETRTGQLGWLVDGLAGQMRAGPVRLLLVARSAGDWWADFGRSSPRRRSIVDGVAQTELPPLDDTLQGRQQAYTEAVAAFAHQLGRDPALGSTPALADPTYGLVLNLHMAALAAVLEAAVGGDGHPDRSADPVARVLDHEQRYWQDSAQAAGLGGTYEQVDLDRAVAAATLCGAQDEAQAVVLLGRIPNLPAPEQAVRLARLLRRLYPSRSGYWAPLQPDLLGEELIAQVTADPVLSGGPAGLLTALLTDATDQQVQRALTVLARAAPRHLHLRQALGPLLQSDPGRLPLAAVSVATQARDPGPLVAALRQILDNLQDSPLILQLQGQLPELSLALADLAVDATRLALDYHRRQAEPNLGDVARVLNNLSIRFSAVGRREEALAAIQEAVAVYRRLAEAAPDAFLRDLSRSLRVLVFRP